MLVDDHCLFRDGLKFILSQISGYTIIGEASNGKEFLELLRATLPDLVLMDIAMPEMDGIMATKRALNLYPDLKIVALSSYGDEIYYRRMIEEGVLGFLTKSSNKEELEFAINTVANGNNYFSQDLLKKVVINISKKDKQKTDEEIKLTQREKEILKCICQGLSNKEIAEKLFISPKTVDNHRTSLLSKTSSKNTASLVMCAIKKNLIYI
ncbi:MAG: response regulator transcription factor [Bacteroidales bacterium]|nr:MAG: response regulator transcription factor [Bacteroidales bacterium]